MRIYLYVLRKSFSYSVLTSYDLRYTIKWKGGSRMIRFKVKVMLAVRDMTQKELAERTGIRPPTISAICLGTIKQLPIEGLNKICKALDCQPSDLMEYVEDSTEDTPETAE